MGKDLETTKPVQEWKQYIEPVLKSKVQEFKLLGYNKVTQEEIWNCLVERIWKGNPERRLHEIVQDVYHLSANEYMNYMTIDAYQADDLMASIQALTKDRSDD